MRSYRKMASGMVLGLAAAGGAYAEKPDPYLWLEDVGGDKPLAWVKEQNAVALKELQAQPDYPGIHERLTPLVGPGDELRAEAHDEQHRRIAPVTRPHRSFQSTVGCASTLVL